MEREFSDSGLLCGDGGEYGNEEIIANYVKNQRNEYKKLF